jgi:Protein of unknown function (DUF4197)
MGQSIATDAVGTGTVGTGTVGIGTVDIQTGIGRRSVLVGALAAAASTLFSWPVLAGILDGGGLKSMLGKASDGALDKLSKPGAFYADTAIRILLPGAGGKLASKMLAAGDKLGVTKKLTQSLNDAAGLAALEAKPVFRNAVDGLKLTDVPDIALKKDGATQYLEKSASPDLRVKVKPLVASALTKVGAFSQLSKVGKSSKLLGLAGLTPEKLTDSVTDQTLKGIFNYIGREESGLRGNVLGVGKSILGSIN